MSKNKVNLTVLKRLVSELEASLLIAEGIKPSSDPDKVEGLIEYSKALGLTTSILAEAGFLMGDIQHQMFPTAPSAGKGDLLEKLLGFKGPGNAN